MSRGSFSKFGEPGRSAQGGWVTAAIGAATAIYSASQSRREGRRARQAGARGQGFDDQRQQLAEQSVEWGGEMMDDYREHYAPLHGELADLAHQTPSEAQRSGQVRADVRRNMASSREQRQRQQRRQGVAPGTGMAEHAERRDSIDQARLETGLGDMAKQQARDERFNRTRGVLEAGQGLISGAARMRQGGEMTLADLAGGQYGREQMHRQTGAGYAGMAGQGLGMVSDWWENRDTGG